MTLPVPVRRNLVRCARHMGLSASDADDVVQEVCQRLIASGKRTNMSYLRKAVIYRTLDWLKRGQPEEPLHPDTPDLAAADALDEIGLRADVERALARLDPDDRELARIALATGNERTAARELGLKRGAPNNRESALRPRLRRIKAELRVALADYAPIQRLPARPAQPGYETAKHNGPQAARRFWRSGLPTYP